MADNSSLIIFLPRKRKEEKKKKECLLASEVEGCVKVLQTKISIL